MPVNAGPEYFAAEKKYSDAKTKKEKIVALEEMIRLAPKHKSSEKLLRDLRKRLAKLKKELKKEVATRAIAKPKFIIRKEGAAQVCIIGLTNSGKSSLLRALTNAKVEIGDYPFTTKLPAVGMMDYTGVRVQLVEIPSTFTPDVVSIVRTCDLVLILLDGTSDLQRQLGELTDLLEKSGLESKRLLIVASKSDKKRNENVLYVSATTGNGLLRLKEEIWSRLGLIRVHTKSPDAPKADKPLTLKPGSTVRDVVKGVHKTMLKDFRFARVFNKTKHSGRKVGLDYMLSDLDVVEIHAG
jgi:small GTP-binding protein